MTMQEKGIPTLAIGWQDNKSEVVFSAKNFMLAPLRKIVRSHIESPLEDEVEKKLREFIIFCH